VRRARDLDVRRIKRVVGTVRNPNCDWQTTVNFGLPISAVKFTILGQILPITVHIDLTLEQRYRLFGLIVSGFLVSGLLVVIGSIMRTIEARESQRQVAHRNMGTLNHSLQVKYGSCVAGWSGGCWGRNGNKLDILQLLADNFKLFVASGRGDVALELLIGRVAGFDFLLG
jgi:hypothetical protein